MCFIYGVVKEHIGFPLRGATHALEALTEHSFKFGRWRHLLQVQRMSRRVAGIV